MPMSRYEIRNEYSLADPDLYRTADKDDPEALLEGVAMAGLVGLLRQLGDLAEFAAEIFHNLHEDVMATASRGHAIAFRVQQLEMEIPSIERAFLSQTDHSSFFYHPGVDWHPNLRLDNDLITQGDMPRFIMDSYEECRAPPRLFLLDKFDVAGAGACLKRYTDPSFFKVETSEMTSADIQREKKIRKAKKKGPRWRNRETHEVLPTSHAKLHQLFLEERFENGISIASERAKLKRRLNGFPFDSKAGASYMEKLLKSPSPDHNVLRDMTVDSPQLKLATNDQKDHASEVLEVRIVGAYRERGRKRSTPSSPDRESVAQNPPMYDSDECPIGDEICEVPSSYPSIAINGISSGLDNVAGKKVVTFDAESNKEGSFTGNESDGMASEIDNFVDAPSTMETEMKRDETSPVQLESLITDAYEEPHPSRSSGSQSPEDSTMSDGRNNSSRKEVSGFSSDCPSVSAEKPHSESSSTKGFQCTDISVNEIVGAPSYQETADEDFLVHHSKPVVSDETHTETDAFNNRRSESESSEKVSNLDYEEENTDSSIGPQCAVSDGTGTETNAVTNQRSEFGQVTSALCINGSMPTLKLSDPEEVEGDHKLEAPGADEMVSMTDDKEKMMNSVIIPPFSPSACISGLQSEDGLSRSSGGEQLLDEPNDESATCLSTARDINHTTDSSDKTSSCLLYEDEPDGEDPDLADDAASTLSILNILSTSGTLDKMSSGNRIEDKFENEFPEVLEKSPPDYPDGARTGDNIERKGDSLINVWDDEESNVSTDSLNHSPCIMEATLEKGLEETSLASVRALIVEDNHFSSSCDNEISLEDLKISDRANCPDSPMEGLDAHDGDVIPEEDTTMNETLLLGTPEPCEVVGFQGTGISYHVSPKYSESVEIPHCTSKDLEESAGASDTVEMDGISVSSGSDAQEVAEITSPAALQPANGIRVLLDKSGSEVDISNTTDITSPPALAVFDCASLRELVEERNDCLEDSGIHEHENDKSCPSEGESDHVEKVGPTKTSASGFGTIVYNSVDNDHPKSEPSGFVPNSHLDLDFDHSQEVVHAAKIQPPIEQFGVDREQEELFNKNDLENHVPDAPSLAVNTDTEESVQFGLPPSNFDQHLPHPSEISPELSPSSSMNCLQILDNIDGKGESNSISPFSLVNDMDPPSIVELSRLSNNEINVPGYPKDPLLSICSPRNPFLEVNQMSLSDLPPLPPLPPVQWRMGKLQHSLPSAEEEMLRNEESFPQLIFPIAATDDVGSTLSTDPAADGSSPPTAPSDEIISLLDEMKDSSSEIAAETILKVENLKNSCSSTEAKTLHETTGHPSKMENKLQLLTTPISVSVSTSSAAEDGTGNGSQKVKLLETTDHPSKMENKLQLLATPISESVYTSSAAEDGAENRSQKVKLHETADHPSKMENKPQLLAIPISESVSTSTAAEDGAESGSQKVKLLRPRTPLVDDVAFLDKSKLRKVTERVRPEIQKVDKRDSLLEQIRTKSFNLKPAMASRPSIRVRGPDTNLKVVAILEKANAIRQAFAGSDEDDDDSWSE